VLEKAHHNKFTLNKEKNITNDHSKSSLVLWYKMRKWEYFFKDKRKKEKKNREQIKKREKVGKKREGGKIKERKRKIKQGKKSCSSNKLL
jgi:hypothetical protein